MGTVERHSLHLTVISRCEAELRAFGSKCTHKSTYCWILDPGPLKSCPCRPDVCGCTQFYLSRAEDDLWSIRMSVVGFNFFFSRCIVVKPNFVIFMSFYSQVNMCDNGTNRIYSVHF